MTTIVCNRTTMAGDTQLTDDSGPMSHGRKVWKHKGSCIGIAGTYIDCIRFVNWYKGGMKEPLTEEELGDVQALILAYDGSIYFFDGHAQSFKITDAFCAIGSGAQAAMGAMHMGATPEQAIRIASKCDAFTGGKITIRTRGK